mgnify:CR=1 FL=1
MKKIFIITFIILISSHAYGQKLKGSVKYGGDHQKGEPFKISYRSIMMGTVKNGMMTTGIPVEQETVVFFNFNNENIIKVVDNNGKHYYIYNINNIVITKYRQEAEGGDQDAPPYNNMQIFFSKGELTIIDNKSRVVIRLTMPK